MKIPKNKIAEYNKDKLTISRKLNKLINEYMLKNDIERKDLEYNICSEIIHLSKEAFYTYKRGTARPDDETIKKLEEFFNKRSGYLTCGEQNDKKKIIHYIKKSFLDKNDLIECYMLSKFYNYYALIGKYEWAFIYNYSLLNEKGKECFKQEIHDLEIHTFLDRNLNILDDITLCKEIGNLSEEKIKKQFDSFCSKSKIKNKKSLLWSRLKLKLNKSDIGIIKSFFANMNIITTMDKDDWAMLICFIIYDRTNTKSNGEIKFLTILESLLTNKEFSYRSSERMVYEPETIYVYSKID